MEEDKVLSSNHSDQNKGEFPVQNGESNGLAAQGQHPMDEDPPKREITQTDHLNKRLLNSFLERLNSQNSGNPLFGGQPATEGNREEQDFVGTEDMSNSTDMIPATKQWMVIT